MCPSETLLALGQTGVHVPLGSTDPFPTGVSPHFPNPALSGPQWPSVALSGPQWPSVALSGPQVKFFRGKNEREFGDP